MQANDFEENIQNTLKSFRVSPSNEVWRKVEAHIAKKKRRRIIGWWFCASLFLCSALFIVFKRSESNPSALTDISSSNLPKATGKLPAFQNGITSNHNNVNDINEATIKNKNNATFENKYTTPPIRKDGPLSTNINPSKSEQTGVRRSQNKSNIPEPDFGETKSGQSKMESLEGGIGKSFVAAPVNKKNRQSDSIQTQLKKDEPAINKNLVQVEKAKLKESIQEPSMLKKTATLSNRDNGKWRFGFGLTGGFSDNLTSANSNNQMAEVNASNQNFSDSKQRLAFVTAASVGFGIYAQKELNKKFLFSAGLGYHLFQAKSLVGNKVNQRLLFVENSIQQNVNPDEYFEYGTSTQFLNQYHILELPVNFTYQINKSKQHPIGISSGFTPAMLLGSRALIENRERKIFYTESNQFNRFSLSLQAGIRFTVINGKSYNVELGPIIQYQLSNLVKPAISPQQRLLFTGINAMVILK